MEGPRVETLPAFLGAGNPTVVARPHDVETLAGDLRETPAASAAVRALREAVEKAGAGCRQDAAAAAWRAESVVRFLCAAFGACLAGVRVSGDGFIVITAELAGRSRRGFRRAQKP